MGHLATYLVEDHAKQWAKLQSNERATLADVARVLDQEIDLVSLGLLDTDVDLDRWIGRAATTALAITTLRREPAAWGTVEIAWPDEPEAAGALSVSTFPRTALWPARWADALAIAWIAQHDELIAALAGPDFVDGVVAQAKRVHHVPWVRLLAAFARGERELPLRALLDAIELPPSPDEDGIVIEPAWLALVRATVPLIATIAEWREGDVAAAFARAIDADGELAAQHLATNGVERRHGPTLLVGLAAVARRRGLAAAVPGKLATLAGRAPARVGTVRRTEKRIEVDPIPNT